ncbi:hypothetical protein WH297_12170 [Ochrobactrum vermis]|uniref:Uncharacterized protein n=1 Tax=Ochrobactrum vermis TaxID=1827297 RepID=A0ABU8PE07_9HYPH
MTHNSISRSSQRLYFRQRTLFLIVSGATGSMGSSDLKSIPKSVKRFSEKMHGSKQSVRAPICFNQIETHSKISRRYLSVYVRLDQIPEDQQGDETQQDVIQRADIVKIFHSASPSPGGRDSV